MEVSDDGEEADEEEEAEEEETAAARRLRERRERTAGGVTALAAAPAPAPAVTVAIPVAPAAPVPASPAAGRAVPTGVPVKTPTSMTPTEWAELGRYVRPWEQGRGGHRLNRDVLGAREARGGAALSPLPHTNN